MRRGTFLGVGGRIIKSFAKVAPDKAMLTVVEQSTFGERPRGDNSRPHRELPFDQAA